MVRANFTLDGTPRITVTCHNDLAITGTPGHTLTVDIDDESPASRVDRHDLNVEVQAANDCAITCPDDAELLIKHASGDLHVSQIKGAITIGTVNGDAALYDIGPLQLQTVQGDLSLRDAGGDVHIDTVRGDAKLKRVAGRVNVGRVAGDLVAHDLDSGATFGKVGGDAQLELEFKPGEAYLTKAGGDIDLRVNGGGATLTLACQGDLRTRLPLTNWAGNDQSGRGVYGDGSASVSLSAGGDLLVRPAKPDRFDPDALSDQVESMIESAMSQFESQMSKVQRDLAERWNQSGQAQRAAERAQRSAERLKRRTERTAGAWSTAYTPPARPPAPPSEPVSDEERLLVLKMVQEGKLSVDEAAKLLAAMEG